MNPYYEQKILSSDPIELVRLVYQRAISSVGEAREHLQHRRIAERSAAIMRAYEAIHQLLAALRPEVAPELCARLQGLYLYIQRRLLDANMQQADPPLARRQVDREGLEQGCDKTLALREKLHRIEGQAATERRDSFEAGRRQGDQETRTELLRAMERLNASIAEIIAMRPDLRRRAERDVVQLALLIAKRVLHRQLNVDEDALTAIARVAFERLRRSESYTITVHSRFAGAVKSGLPGKQISRVHIQPDPNCERGTFIIRSAAS